MDRHGQTAHVGGDSVGRRENRLGGGGLLSLRSQSAERRRERGLILTLRDKKQNQKTTLTSRDPKARKHLDVNVQERDSILMLYKHGHYP